MKAPSRASGVSLVELIATLVVISIAGVSLITYVNQTVAGSADPQMIQQANAIARAYMEEITLRPVCDPDFVTTSCPLDCTTSACGSCSGAEPSRNLFDDVCDYDALSDTGARDQSGGIIPELEDFNVEVEVVDDASVDLNGLTGDAGEVLQVNVSVTHDGNQRVDVRLTGYRVNF